MKQKKERINYREKEMEESYKQLGEFSTGEYSVVRIQEVIWDGKVLLDIRKFRLALPYAEDKTPMATRSGIRFYMEHLSKLADILNDLVKKQHEESKKDGNTD